MKRKATNDPDVPILTRYRYFTDTDERPPNMMNYFVKRFKQ